jgi:fructose-1,6-bisphosphatase/sedoheptulose 1,7-bisphosphatase-like protein
MPARRSSVSHSQLVEFAGMLGATLAAIERGDLTASPSTRLRVEGALVTLRVLAGDAPESIIEALMTEPA